MKLCSVHRGNICDKFSIKDKKEVNGHMYLQASYVLGEVMEY